jgi:hypothetical protein
MHEVLSTILVREPKPYDPPSASDWDALSAKFGCTFADDFKGFIDLMATYMFPGDIFNVSTGRTNGKDSVALVYDLECRTGQWDPTMVPFYGIGNGDYSCLSARECPRSAVYYYYHDRGRYEAYSPTVDDWIRQLPQFLA